MGNIELTQEEIKERTELIKKALNSDFDIMRLNAERLKFYEMCPKRIITINGVYLPEPYQKMIGWLNNEIKKRKLEIIKHYSRGFSIMK